MTKAGVLNLAPAGSLSRLNSLVGASQKFLDALEALRAGSSAASPSKRVFGGPRGTSSPPFRRPQKHFERAFLLEKGFRGPRRHLQRAFSLEQDLPGVPRKTCPVFQAGHSVRSAQEIPFAPNKTSVATKKGESPFRAAAPASSGDTLSFYNSALQLCITAI